MNQLYFIGYDNNSRPFPNQGSGKISFSGQEVSLARIAGGVMLWLGYSINLRDDLHVSISGISGEIGVAKGSLPPLTLGIAIDPQCHVIDTGYKFPGLPTGEPQTMVRGHLRLPLSLAALETVERLRQGEPFEFTVVMRGSVFVHDKQTKLYETCRFQVGISSGTPIQFRADRDNWIQQMRNVSPMGSILVEIPLAIDRKAPWDEVWRSLESAKANLAQGGEGGCKSCINEVRQAIEVWRKIDDFSGAKTAKEKNKRERLQDVANALFHYCSLSVHTDHHISHWTRADAILALASLCSLLSARDP